jgi:intein/homing endonuclease
MKRKRHEEDPKVLQEHLDQAEKLVSSTEIPQRRLTDEEMGRLADVVLVFSQKMTGITLFPYQIEFGWRIVYSILIEDAEEITSLFSRQCIGQDQVVLDREGSAHKMCELSTATKTGDCRDVYRLRLQGGYEIDSVTLDHVFFTPDGEKALGDLCPGDRIAVATKVNKWANTLTVTGFLEEYINMHSPKEELVVETGLSCDLAYLLGLLASDGSINKKKQSPKFTNTNEHLCEILEEIVLDNFHDVTTKWYEKGNGWDVLITAGKKVSRGNSFTRFLRILDWDHGFPRDIFDTNEDLAGAFLAGIISGDGCIQNSRNLLEISCGNDCVYARYMQALLLKLGVRSTVKNEVMTKGTGTFYRVVIHGYQNLKTMTDIKELTSRIYWAEDGKGEAWKILIDWVKSRPVSGTKGVGKGNVGRKMYPTIENGPDGEDIAWAKIRNIDHVGEDEVWDVEVPEKGWFLCQGIKAHNSGKSETAAVVIDGMLVLLPIFAKSMPADDRLKKFENGFWVGIYAPGYKQAAIIWSRVKARMYSQTAKEALLEDPDIDIDLGSIPKNMTLPNGSFANCETAAPQANIEGTTYHLIVCDETHDISSTVLRSSIHPMLAATAGSIVKIGTCNQSKSEFYEACRRNKRHDVQKGLARSKTRLHFEFDYTVAQRHNPRYRKYVEKEILRLGYDSDDFRMKYRLHWLLERGMFVSQDLFDECGIKGGKDHLTTVIGRGRRSKRITFTRAPGVVKYDNKTPRIQAAIDVGREKSTVVTVAKVFWDCPISYGDERRYPMHIYNWLELYGDDHEVQHPKIVSFLKNYQISDAIVDATGKGDPVYSRLAAELDRFGINVQPFIFSAQSKDVGYKVLHQELSTKRITYPAGASAARLRKWQKFIGQMHDLEKHYRGQTMVVEKSKDDKDASDDFPDSLMMLCWLVNVQGSMEVETSMNPFVGRAARWVQADMIKTAGNWWRNVMGPGARSTRPGKSGRWD